jgi:hypothetical protein
VNPATQAAARAYAEVLRRRGKRSYIVVCHSEISFDRLLHKLRNGDS